MIGGARRLVKLLKKFVQLRGISKGQRDGELKMSCAFHALERRQLLRRIRHLTVQNLSFDSICEWSQQEKEKDDLEQTT
jgi:hypothetical protein